MPATMIQEDLSIKPVLATIVGIALFSAMDAVMKSASIAIGAYSAYLVRCAIGFVMIAPVWWWRKGKFPKRHVMKVHVIRGVVVAVMGWTFFAALVRLPLGETIAISFIAPLIALYFAAILLGEKIETRATVGALLGLVGVIVIVAGRIGRERMNDDALIGLGLVGFSAVLFAWNLILQRQQALLASPEEVGTFQNGIALLTLAAGTPFLFVLPVGRVWIELTAGAILSVSALLFLTWAYARAETQRLVPIEYTGFLWASLFGWLYFGERVTGATLSGAALIVAGCWIATSRRRRAQSTL